MIKSTLLIVLLLFTTQVYSDTAIVTYHLYTQNDKLTTVSCSDGANGLMSWGYNDLSQMFPYVTAWQPASWNSPQCGSCIKIDWNGKYTYVTVIDQCGMINSAYSHFDMSKQAFLGLFGQQGYAKGTMTANFTIVASKYCTGNKKGFAGSTTQNTSSSSSSSSSNTSSSSSSSSSTPYNTGQNQSSSSSSSSSSPYNTYNTWQNKYSSSASSYSHKYKNPLWVKAEHDIRPNLISESLQTSPQQQYSQSYDSNIQSGTQTTTNPLWIKSPSSQSQYQPQNTQQQQVSSSETTQWGGYSYDKQNARNERGGW